MCGRYALRSPRARLEETFELQVPEWVTPRFNIAPSQAIAVIRERHGQREWAALRWGLIPFWSKQDNPRYATINARAETVAEKPAYRKPFRAQRCLIPADGFYEWKAAGKAKQPFFIHLKDDAPFAFAGLWDRWQQGEQVIESATLIVTDANAAMAPVHERMPVILSAEHWQLWLDQGHFDAQQLQALLKPYAGKDLELNAVNRTVNSPSNDSADCVAPAAQGDLLGD